VYFQDMSDTKADNSNRYLTNHFLVAMPQLQDSYFANTVIYMWRHTDEGALGLVVNLPIKMQLDEIFEQLGIEDLRQDKANQIILSGGPVETEKGFVLHNDQPRWPSSMRITDELTLTTSREILADIGQGQGPEKFLVALGCAGWRAGQLEQEIRQNSWLTIPAQPEIIFSTDFAHKPDMAAATLGFTMAQMTSDVGYI
jgi:putative transcriptional regulator